ncbi:MAG: hypothetical protein JWQ36_3114 [Enterovirga sp.]|nr:hypothetical protein [Enterovirga sp.]
MFHAFPASQSVPVHLVLLEYAAAAAGGFQFAS